MSIRLGNNPVIKLSIGAQIISMVYVGTNIVYSGEWTPFELFAAILPLDIPATEVEALFESVYVSARNPLDEIQNLELVVCNDSNT